MISPHRTKAATARVLKTISLVTVVCACLVAKAAGAEPPPNHHGLQMRLAACAACHGKRGQGDLGRNGGVYPRLAGQPVGYLYAQMLRIQAQQRTGIPPVAIMHRLLAQLPNRYLHLIAEYYHNAFPPFPPRLPIDSAQWRRGRELVEQGLPQSGIASCASCHGTHLQGRPPDVPGLAGQYARYLEIQFAHWTQGARHNRLHEHIARVLSTAQVRAVASYLASLRPSGDHRSAADHGDQSTAPNRPETTRLPPAMSPGVTLAAPTDRSTDTPSNSDSTTLSRGRYLTRVGDCRSCHTLPGHPAFSGGRPIETPFGTIYTPNITPDKATGIGNWTARNFYNALHEGIGPNDEYLYPAFPFPAYTHLSRKDVNAIRAYLRNVEPVRQGNRANALRWPYSMRNGLKLWRLLYFRADSFKPDAGHSARWNRGAYLVRGLAHCGACHTPRGRWGARIDSQALAGGTVAIDNWIAPNITPNPHTGIGQWSTDAVKRFLTTGRSDRGDALGPMREVVQSSLQYLKERDIDAIAAYLQKVPARGPERVAASAANDAPAANHQSRSPGQMLYRKHCADCHGDDGRAKHAFYPDLRGNSVVLASNPTNLILIMLRGGFQASTATYPYPYSMQPFGFRLSNDEIAAIANYVRHNWSHRTPVTVWRRQVDALR